MFITTGPQTKAGYQQDKESEPLGSQDRKSKDSKGGVGNVSDAAMKEFQLRLLPLVTGIRKYHQHEVFGLDQIPNRGPVIIACNHSLATYDMILLMAAVFLKSHRQPRALIDRAFYKVPGLGNMMEHMGCIIGSQENAHQLLSNGNTLYLAPGGMRESLRPSTQRYQIRWNDRKGFARLSIETGTPIMLAACPSADDIFTVYENALTKWVYKSFKLPVALARGIGPSLLPKPVKLTHYLSKPIYPPKKKDDPAAFKRQVFNFHRRLVKEMKAMIESGIVNQDIR